jgi:hypothetical protein
MPEAGHTGTAGLPIGPEARILSLGSAFLKGLRPLEATTTAGGGLLLPEHPSQSVHIAQCTHTVHPKREKGGTRWQHYLY